MNQTDIDQKASFQLASFHGIGMYYIGCCERIASAVLCSCEPCNSLRVQQWHGCYLDNQQLYYGIQIMSHSKEWMSGVNSPRIHDWGAQSPQG